MNVNVMQIIGWMASLCVFMAFFMKTMVRLRLIAISSNIVFISYTLVGLYYGIFWDVFPILVLHSALLPLNILRLRQERNLIRKIKISGEDRDAVRTLIPYMKKIICEKGTRLFKRGDPAKHIYFLQSGTVEIPEVYKRISHGVIFGEIGLFVPNARRTASATCIAECEIYRIHKDKVLELFYQNPQFGFFIVRMLAHYLNESVDNIVPPGTTVEQHLNYWKSGFLNAPKSEGRSDPVK